LSVNYVIVTINNKFNNLAQLFASFSGMKAKLKKIFDELDVDNKHITLSGYAPTPYLMPD
jgi:predicted esterase